MQEQLLHIQSPTLQIKLKILRQLPCKFVPPTKVATMFRSLYMTKMKVLYRGQFRLAVNVEEKKTSAGVVLTVLRQ